MNPHTVRKIRKIISPIRKIGIKKPFTIISNNCWGGIQYDKFGMQYTSPTVGLHIPAQDFVKFCSNLKHYLSFTPVPFDDKTYNNHLKAKIDDITLEFVHYSDIDIAIQKWEKRKTRIVWDNIICKMEDSYGEGQICGEDQLDLFSKLPYKKILFYSFNESANKYDFAIKLNNHTESGFIKDEFKQADKKFKLHD